MARIKTSGLISDISGSVSGMTFQKSSSGLTLRKKPIPLNPQSPPQLIQRSAITYLQNLWISLSQPDRDKWIYFLSWSNQSQNHNSKLIISGYQLFIKYQSARMLAGLSPLLSFVFEPINKPYLPFSFYNPGVTFYILFHDYVSNSQYFFNLFLSSPVNVGTKFRNYGLKFMPVFFTEDHQYYLYDSYLKYFGEIPLPGQQVNYKIYWFGINSPVLGFYETGTSIIKTL
jgi:hypothetical protein